MESQLVKKQNCKRTPLGTAQVVANLLPPLGLASVASDDCWLSLEVVQGDLQHLRLLPQGHLAELDQTCRHMSWARDSEHTSHAFPRPSHKQRLANQMSHGSKRHNRFIAASI